MDRRKFILGSLVSLLAPLAGQAQQAPRIYRVGVLESQSAALNKANLDAFRQGLQEHEYVEGGNLVIVYRSADGHTARFPDLAAELVRLNVDIILTQGTPAVMAAMKATRTIPIVMASSGDPLGAGVVGDLAHPGGNVTGLSALSTAEMSSKRVQLLREAAPRIQRIGAVVDMGNPGDAQWTMMEREARSMGLQIELLDVRKPEDLVPAFDAGAKQRVDAVIVGYSAVALISAERIAELCVQRRLPSMFFARDFVAAGGLMAYGANYPKQYRRAAAYVDKILKGTKPGDLPIEQPTKFELVINLKTAKALGITIPQSLLLRADEVIQ